MGKVDSLDLFRNPSHLIRQNDEDLSCVITKSDLKNQLELFCAKVKHPVTIFSFYDSDEDNKIKRVDSAISSVSLHYCCETFRICAGIECCEQSDIDHALLFKGKYAPIQEKELEEKVQENIYDYFKKSYNKSIYYNASSPEPTYVRCPNNKNGYIRYYCPILGYLELIFPIVVCGKVLGAIFCGQVCYGDEQLIKEIRQEFLNQNPDIFNCYLKENPKVKKEKLLNDLKEGVDIYKTATQYPVSEETKSQLLDKCWITERRPERLSEKDYNELINSILLAIEEMSDALLVHMVNIRKNYITHTIKDITYNFCQDAMRDIFPIYKEDNILDYWNIVEHHLSCVVEKLSLRDIHVYGTTNPTIESEELNKLKMIVFACPATSKNSVDFIKSKYYFKLEKTDKENKLPFLSANSFKFGKLNIKSSSYLRNRIIDDENHMDNYCKNMDILYYPVYDNLSHSSALVIDYFDTEYCPNLLEDTKFIYETIITELYPFSNLIFYLGAYLLNCFLQTTTEMVLRFFKHELSHVLLGFNFLNEVYIQNFRHFVEIDEKKRNDVIGDFISTEEMMRAISTNIELLTKPTDNIKLNIEEFKIFKELLFKWENLYRYDIAEKGLSFCNPNINFDDPDRPLIKCDKRLLEQIIYNIVHNAIKYSNWGTRIEIDCRKKKTESNTQILSIVDYGAAIEKGDKPYTLYYRNPDIKQTIEGTGIGLFVVKRIANILGIKVRHFCEPVSKFNVALIDAYIFTPFEYVNKDKDLLRNLQLERNKLGDKIKRFVSDNRQISNLTEQEIADLIMQPTFKVTFEVEI